MYAVVVGGGDFGREIIRTLLGDKWKITLIDIDEKVCKEISEEFGITTLVGDGTDPDMLSKAEVDRVDLFISATGDDNVNVISGFLARDFGAKRVIVRLKSRNLTKYLEEKGIEYITPESSGAKDILEMTLSTRDFLEFEGLKIFLYKVEKSDRIVGRRIIDIEGFWEDFVIFAVKGENLELVDKEMVADPGDILYVATKRDIRDIVRRFR